ANIRQWLRARENGGEGGVGVGRVVVCFVMSETRAFAENPGGDWAWRNRVDPDAFLAEFDRGAPCQVNGSRLRYGVIEPAQPSTRAVDARNRDDAARSLCGHDRHRMLHRGEAHPANPRTSFYRVGRNQPRRYPRTPTPSHRS